ncbi:MAG: iron-containing alcohol dehydrogenase [Pseudomonadota bacterium]
MLDTSNADILLPQDWTFPVPISYGPGRMVEIGQRCGALQITNPLIVTDRGSRNLPFIEQLQHHLHAAGIPSAVFGDISPNPRDDEIGAGKAMFRAGAHDAIIAIGGGSAMDGGKSICLTCNTDIDIWAFEFEQPVPDVRQPFPTLVTIPTTAGTGAETESTAMVTHVDKAMKFCVWHPALKPALVLLDPELTVGLPRDLTAWTGADALTHAIEAYLVPGFHPLCDGLALEGLALVAQWLPVAVKEPDNIEARGGMLVGSCLAGIAFLKGLGLVHAISHMIGAEFNTQHGLTNAIVLPVVLRFNLPGQEQKVKRMSDSLGIDDHSVAAFTMEVERILDEIGIPQSLAEIGVPAECAQRIAEKALLDSAAGTNPRPASVDEVCDLVTTALHKARNGNGSHGL